MWSSASAGVVSSPISNVVFISGVPDAETRTVKCDGRYHRRGMTWAARRAFAALATAVAITAITTPVIAQTDEDAAQQAAAEIVAARERANAAAEAFIAAESKQA